ncbi:SAM-dependent methyltransferase [Actinomycetes bacterium KLBMP 9759]
MPGQGPDPVTPEWAARHSVPGSPICAPEWLALREPADAAARAPQLVDVLRQHLGGCPLTVRDLGCGTGSMGRWLAPQLDGPQEWVLHDRDADLLALAAANMPTAGADGRPVTATTHAGDLGGLSASDLAGTSLVTASALLDILTAEEVDALASICAEAGTPALLTLSVAGRVAFTPGDPLDAEFAAAFDAHQRRTVGGRRLLGPDAPELAAAAFRSRGLRLHAASSPWALGRANPELLEEWLRGWIDAAREQRPALAPYAGAYLQRKLTVHAEGGLRVTVGHTDLLALPGALV